MEILQKVSIICLDWQEATALQGTNIWISLIALNSSTNEHKVILRWPSVAEYEHLCECDFPRVISKEICTMTLVKTKQKQSKLQTGTHWLHQPVFIPEHQLLQANKCRRSTAARLEGIELRGIQQKPFYYILFPSGFGVHFSSFIIKPEYSFTCNSVYKRQNSLFKHLIFLLIGFQKCPKFSPCKLQMFLKKINCWFNSFFLVSRSFKLFRKLDTSFFTVNLDCQKKRQMSRPSRFLEEQWTVFIWKKSLVRLKLQLLCSAADSDTAQRNGFPREVIIFSFVWVLQVRVRGMQGWPWDQRRPRVHFAAIHAKVVIYLWLENCCYRQRSRWLCSSRISV